MKNLLKLMYAYLILACSLLACTPTNDLINDLENESLVNNQMKRLVGNNITNALTFDSIAQADEILDAMKSIDDASVFYDTYIRNNNVHNKYLTSIHEYLGILNTMAIGDSITAMLALEALRDSLFNVFIEDGDTIVEPLANFDYRCLVNEDDIFIVGDRAYHLFDTIFVTCPIYRHSELVEISQNPYRLQLFIEELKAEQIKQFDTIKIQSRSGNSIADYEIMYFHPYTGKMSYTYEKKVGKQRMQVIIDTEENYIKYLNRHDLKTKYTVKSHQKCLGIWWIQKVITDIDIKYDAWFTYGSNTIEQIPNNLFVSMKDNRTVTQFYPSKDEVHCYPYTKIPYIHNDGIVRVDFTISNPYLTITEVDFKSWTN